MGAHSKGVYVNGNALKEFCNKNKLNKQKIARDLGRGDTYLNHCITENRGDLAFMKAFCVIYNADFKELTTKPVEVQTVESGDDTVLLILADITKRLERIENSIKNGTVEIKANVDELTDIENATLLLNMMMKYGSCEEKLYKAKGKSLNISDTAMTEVIRNNNLKRNILNGKCWLER